MAHALLSIALLITQPVAPAPPGAGPGETSTTAEHVASPWPNLVAAQPVLLTVEAEPAPEMASTTTNPRSMVPPPPEPELYPSDAMLAALRMCESSDRYGINTGNSFHGAYQFLQSTWNAAAARAGRPDLIGVPVERVAPADQDAITRFWWNASDPRHEWPVCSRNALRAA